jgi:ATP-binding cassette subfamily B protein
MLAHARPYRGSLAGLAFAGLIVAACDVFQPRITGAVIDNAITGAGERIWIYGGLYLGFVAVRALVVWLFIVLAGVAATGVAYDLRRAAFSRLQDLSFSFYDHRPAGWLIARLTTDCERISSVLPWTLLDAVWGSFLLSGITAMMLWMNWKLALVVLSIVPPLSLATAVYQKKLIRTQRLVRKTNSKITASFNEGITGVRTTKAFVREEQNLSEFHTLTDEMFRQSLGNALHAAVYLPVVMTLGAAGVGLAMWRGGLLAVDNNLALGDLVAFMQYAALFHIPIQEMAQRFTGLQAAQASAERLQGLLDTEPEITDSPEIRAAIERQRCVPQPGRALDGQQARIEEIVFENVHFAYKEGGPVLVDFNLKIKAGQCIALVGETGSGKSTVAKLLCRFYEPAQGRILIDGVDYRNRSLHWLQSNLGMVLQEPHLFSGTIRENIRYGRLSATDAEIETVARQVGADAFIQEHAGGYDTEVGENGNRLSTGQKQLVALARALLADPQILVLDEATSSVDTETERLIQMGIEVVLQGRISVIIAHRLSTIRAAERILVIDHGRIVEEGRHVELLRRQGPYAQLYAQQFRKDAAAEALRSASARGSR